MILVVVILLNIIAANFAFGFTLGWFGFANQLQKRTKLGHALKRQQIFASPPQQSVQAESTDETAQIYEDPDENNFIEWNPTLPDRNLFKSYFKSLVVGRSKTISLNQLCLHNDIQMALSDGLLAMEDIDYIWDSPISHDESILDFEGAYELFCSIMDVPDPELINFLNQSFKELTGTISKDSDLQAGISFEAIMKWAPIVEAVRDKYLLKGDVLEYWNTIVGADKVIADRRMFGKFYIQILKHINDSDTGPLETGLEPELFKAT